MATIFVSCVLNLLKVVLLFALPASYFLRHICFGLRGIYVCQFGLQASFLCIFNRSNVFVSRIFGYEDLIAYSKELIKSWALQV